MKKSWCLIIILFYTLCYVNSWEYETTDKKLSHEPGKSADSFGWFKVRYLSNSIRFNHGQSELIL